ncbi:MAG TPA: NAD(P)/FAD-dependent oxidoreductase [Candidatus Margulisiibacteriota bacterium]|nr:NAD(P)/FAD-dependent oxidoreductase [Candidatus Margulisiibacteriota bacterium]
MKDVVIIGAGPAGLAAGERLCSRKVNTLILEKDPQVGGLSRTVIYKGNYFDIGGHRFFTKNKDVFSWWQGLLREDFLKVRRISRIYYKGRYFDYPIALSNVVLNLGLQDSLLILGSYLKGKFFPSRNENNLKEWITNRFGKRLFETFFKGYSEKVLGLSCDCISADWVAERIRGVSFFAAIGNALSRKRNNKIASLIKDFYFPGKGSGVMYEAAAAKIIEQGGRIRLQSEVVAIKHNQGRITGLVCKDTRAASQFEVEGSNFCSSMPITSLISRMTPSVDRELLEKCASLRYRGLVVVYLIIGKAELFPDNWIYVHSPEVRLARIQNFKNWSPDMLSDLQTTTLGMEYFCDEEDTLWSMSNADLIDLATRELEKIGLSKAEDVIDGYVLRVPNAYPVYDKDYRRNLVPLKDFISGFSNLQCIGRYGMFHYGLMDHAVLTGLLAAENILGSRNDLWNLGT